jgi:hypothetical protein
MRQECRCHPNRYHCNRILLGTLVAVLVSAERESVEQAWVNRNNICMYQILCRYYLQLLWFLADTRKRRIDPQSLPGLHKRRYRCPH